MADICIVTKSWRYSIAWIVHSLAGALTDAGLSVALIAPLSDPASREVQSPRMTRIVLPRELVRSGDVLHRALASMRRVLGGLLTTLAERRRTRTFLFTIPDPLVFTLPLFLLLRLSGARVLFMVHDAVPHAWRLPRMLQGLERWAHGLSYRLASELIILTLALRRPLEDGFAVPARKIVVIPHGPLGLGELPPPQGTGRLLLFGHLRSNKSVLEVIEGVTLARRQDPDITLVIAGEPHPSEHEYWERCRTAIGRDPSGFELQEGFLAEEALPGLVSAADAFILAYRQFDSQSGVGILAALSGRPVLCTPAGGLRDLIEDGLCHVLIEQPISAETVAEALLRFRARPFAEWRADASASAGRLASTLSWLAIATRVAERIQR